MTFPIACLLRHAPSAGFVLATSLSIACSGAGPTREPTDSDETGGALDSAAREGESTRSLSEPSADFASPLGPGAEPPVGLCVHLEAQFTQGLAESLASVLDPSAGNVVPSVLSVAPGYGVDMLTLSTAGRIEQHWAGQPSGSSVQAVTFGGLLSDGQDPAHRPLEAFVQASALFDAMVAARESITDTTGVGVRARSTVRSSMDERVRCDKRVATLDNGEYSESIECVLTGFLSAYFGVGRCE